MDATCSCNIVLPNVRLDFKEGVKPQLEEIEIKYNKRKRKRNKNVVPAPSGGDSQILDIDDLEFKIQMSYQARLRRVTNLYLTGKWNEQLPLERFRRVAKVIILAHRWRIPTLWREEQGLKAEKVIEDQQSHLHFNLESFRVATSGNTALTNRVKYILMKDSEDRKPEEIEMLFNLVNQMKCFCKYPATVRREVAALLSFDTFEDGRIIIKEGTQGTSLYYIVSGSVQVEITETDFRTGAKKKSIVHEITSGSSFGELALIQECTRNSTIICKGRSEFLRLDRDDFNLAILQSYEREWLDKLHMVKSIPYFSGWSGKDLRHIILNCFVKVYQPETVILGNVTEVTEDIYFVHSGQCEIVRQIEVLETNYHDIGGCKKMVSLPTSHEIETLKANGSDERHIETRFLNIGQLISGDYFGVGENLQHYYILAMEQVECLVIPRQAVTALERLLSTTGNVLDKKCSVKEMLHHAQSRLLSQNEVFEKWMTNLRWRNFKKKTIQQALQRRCSSSRHRNFLFKDYQFPQTIPTEKNARMGFPICYPVERIGGFVNRNYHELAASLNEVKKPVNRSKNKEKKQDKKKSSSKEPAQLEGKKPNDVTKKDVELLTLS